MVITTTRRVQLRPIKPKLNRTSYRCDPYPVAYSLRGEAYSRMLYRNQELQKQGS